MWWVDVLTTYLFALRFVVVGLAIAMLISGIDDVVVDAIYWIRRLWRSQTVYREHDAMLSNALYAREARPLAIMVPAWQEAGVIERMVKLASSTIDYPAYHLFIGTYPNDPATQLEADAASAKHPHVHKVVCAEPGPTTKSDCLNNIVTAIFALEQQTGIEFAGFVLHDAEDVVSRLELRLFNYLVDRKDLIQIPVYPLQRRWFDITSAHYMDEFAELHGKDIPVREAVAGQVPSAGVGTCFSRRAIMALLEDGGGRAFDTRSLTEDYDIGIRLREKGLEEVFVRFPVSQEPSVMQRLRFGANSSDVSVICVREFFPNTARAAIRQKSRWIIGIVYQGFKAHRWSGTLALDFFLWRDRKGGITNFVSFLSTLVLLQLAMLWVYQRLVPDSYQFLSIFEGGWWLPSLLVANFVLMVNRLIHRVLFVTAYYGLLAGLGSVPRLFWGQYINFMANWRALSQVLRQPKGKAIAWDKTTHDFPTVADEVVS
jgi:adsorption protein B